MDEFTEILTLIQTEKIRRKLPILLFGKEYWERIIEFEPMAEFGTIDRDDLALFHISDSVDESFDWLKFQLGEWAVDHPGAGLTPELDIIGLLDGTARTMPEVRRLTTEDTEIYRAVRLEGLRLHPEAFGASYETEAKVPMEFFSARLSTSSLFGAFDGDALLGIAGHFSSASLKERHKATLFGMYVREIARSRGVGRKLVEAVIADAATQFESIQLTVATANEGARRLYERCGFETYGGEPRSLKVDGVYFDEALMYRRLDG